MFRNLLALFWLFKQILEPPLKKFVVPIRFPQASMLRVIALYLSKVFCSTRG